MTDKVDICPVHGCNEDIARIDMTEKNRNAAIRRCQENESSCFFAKQCEALGSDMIDKILDKVEADGGGRIDMFAVLIRIHEATNA